jgi:hypothetical protein
MLDEVEVQTQLQGWGYHSIQEYMRLISAEAQRNPAQPLAHPEDMGIYRKDRAPKVEEQFHAGSFSTHAGQAQEEIQGFCGAAPFQELQRKVSLFPVDDSKNLLDATCLDA